MKEKLDQAVEEISQHRDEIIAKLLEFAKTDLLFFWGENRDLFLQQKEKWLPILNWAGKELKVELHKTDKLDVPENKEMNGPLAQTLKDMSNKELACYYAAALNMRSTLLALALVKGRIHAEEACRLSYLEELWQNKLWGSDDEAASRRQERCEELKEIESYLHS